MTSRILSSGVWEFFSAIVCRKGKRHVRFARLRGEFSMPVATWSIALEESFRSQCDLLLRSSRSHHFVFRRGGGGGGRKNFFGGKSANESSTPLCKRVLLLYLTVRRMPKAKFWRCLYCRSRSRKRCEHSTSGPLTARPSIDGDSFVTALAHDQTWDV